MGCAVASNRTPRIIQICSPVRPSSAQTARQRTDAMWPKRATVKRDLSRQMYELQSNEGAGTITRNNIHIRIVEVYARDSSLIAR